MKQDYILIRQAVSKELCDFMAAEYDLMEQCCHVIYPNTDFSDYSKNSFARYAPLMFETLAIKLIPLLTEKLGREVVPTYTFARTYYTGSDLQKHFDRPSSEITVSLCVEKDNVDWPLYIKNENDVTHEINLDQGDIVIYSGRRHAHWRNTFTGTKQIQAFLQYVYSDGDSAWLKWDTRASMGLPFEFVSHAIKEEIDRIHQAEEIIQQKIKKAP